MKTIEIHPDLKINLPTDFSRATKILNRYNRVFPVHLKEYPINGFIDYIAFCHNNHFAATINPTDLWYMIQCEIATEVKKNPKIYESLFTTTPDQKQEIIVSTRSVEEINPFAVIDALKARVPSDVNLFIPSFSTNELTSVLTMNIAFCDMVSPYYNYFTCLCGIPYINIGGTKEDWELLQYNLNRICGLFTGPLNSYLKNVHSTVSDILAALEKNDISFFKNIISTKRCGSGSDQYVNGWILRFMNCSDKQIMLKNVHTYRSKMEYTSLETQKKFELYGGIFSLVFKNDMVIPNYNLVRNEITEKLPNSSSLTN